MSVIFLDSSALVRRYDISEPGGSRVHAVCAPGARNSLLIASFTPTEAHSALARKLRDGTLSRSEFHRALLLFKAHRRLQYRRIALTDDVFEHAEALVVKYPVAAADALQIACALAAHLSARMRLQFWTADRQQASAAQAEGLAVERLT